MCPGDCPVLYRLHAVLMVICVGFVNVNSNVICKSNLQFCVRMDKYEIQLVADLLLSHKCDSIPSFVGAVNINILVLFGS